MARIKINIPKKEAAYETRLPLLINFINYGNHMGNDAILTLCQEARIRFMKSLNYSELDFYGSALIQADAAIVFKNEAFHGDELIFKIYIQDLSSHGFDFIYEILNQEHKVIAVSKTGMVFFNYNERKIQTCPDEFTKTYSE